MEFTRRYNVSQNITDQEAIEEVVVAALVAWNHKNAGEFASFFTKDAEFTDVVGQLMLGRAEIERLHTFPFTTVLKNAHLHMKKTKIKTIRPDVASIDVKWETTGHTKPDGSPLPPRYGLLHFVVVKDGDNWAVAVAHNADYTATYGFQDAAKVAQNS